MKYSTHIGFAARLARHWSNGHIAVVPHVGWTFNLGLLFVNLYFYIFNQQRFRAGLAMNSSAARCLQWLADAANLRLAARN